ncbi:hypothetical protein OG800_49640 (plasmid) [Streptomyces sp. NBC_00445]|uniref:hypothetical protein n=1 Tax=Streptomyces sp. NBC_00445 TaxID=2975745 RepID=UPI002E1B0D13
MSCTLTVGVMRTLLDDALTAALACSAATLPVSKMLYTGHRSVMFTETSVVRGGPGAGKSLWARALIDPTLRAAAAHDLQMPRLTTAHVVSGHGVADAHQPTGRELKNLTDDAIRPVTLWTAVALTALNVADITSLPTWHERALWLTRNPDAPRHVAHALNHQAHADTTVHLVVFDALDRIHPEQRIADHLASGVLQLAADLARLGPRVRAKVFLRPDTLYAALEALDSTDQRALCTTDLDWSAAGNLGQVSGAKLHGLLFHLLGNHEGPESAAFRALTPGWRQNPDGRFTAPAPLMRDPDAQERLFTAIADLYMGANVRSGFTHHFLPAHLQDATGELSPRPFLTALRQAVRHAAAEHPDHTRALHHEDIRRGRSAGAHARAAEVEAAMPWVRAALEPLAGQQLPIERKHASSLWDEAGLPDRLRQLGARTADPHPSGMRHLARYRDLVEELIAAGVLRRGTTGLLDVAEPYRLAHRMGRKGGVAREPLAS